MTPAKQTILTLAAAFGFGLFMSYLWFDTEEQDTLEELSKERVTKPENGVKTAPFALNLLQAGMQVQQDGNVIVAPNSLAALLNRLMEFSNGPAKTALEALHLPDESTQTAVYPSEVALLFPDAGLRLQPDIVTGRDIYPVTFSQDLSGAFIAMDKAMGFYTEQELNGTVLSSLITPTRASDGPVVNGHAINMDVRLVGVCGISFHEPWMLPAAASGGLSDFTNADGSTSQAAMVKHKGLYRTAKAQDGSWQAAALFFANNGKTGDSACLVVVLPKGDSAREFAKTLTPEKLGEIRTALLEAPKTHCTIELPAITCAPTSQNLHATLSEMELGSLFTDEKPFPKLTSAVAPLSMLIQQYRLTLAENRTEGDDAQQDPTPDKAAPDFKADHPFFWYIGDLSSDQLPYLMGVIEKL